MECKVLMCERYLRIWGWISGGRDSRVVSAWAELFYEAMGICLMFVKV
jgi:hypothetical protein